MPIPLCVVCFEPAPALYGGIRHLPICYDCHKTGALRKWLDVHPESDPDHPSYTGTWPKGAVVVELPERTQSDYTSTSTHDVGSAYARKMERDIFANMFGGGK